VEIISPIKKGQNFGLEWKNISKNKFKLRKSPANISDDKVESMIELYNFFDRNYNNSGKFQNSFQIRSLNGDIIVKDLSTNLMWYRAGSSSWMTFYGAKEWIKKINSKNFAGYNDWRLPTLEEALTLLTKKTKRGLHNDDVFSRKQTEIWTSDTFGSNITWVINFSKGQVEQVFSDSVVYVRPVRRDN